MLSIKGGKVGGGMRHTWVTLIAITCGCQSGPPIAEIPLVVPTPAMEAPAPPTSVPNPPGGVMKIDARGPTISYIPRHFDTDYPLKPNAKLHLPSMLWRNEGELQFALGEPHERSASFRNYKLPEVEDIMIRFFRGRSISVTIYLYSGYSTAEQAIAKGGLYLKEEQANIIAPMGVHWVDSAGIQVSAFKSEHRGGWDVIQARILDNAIPQQYDTPGSIDTTVTRLQGQSRTFTSKYPTPANRRRR